MLFPLIEVTQLSESELSIQDITPEYSSVYAGGFGFTNPERNQIFKTVITVSIGGMSYEIQQDFDQSTGVTTLDATDLPYTAFHNMMPPGDCDNCKQKEKLTNNGKGYLAAWPSGCVNLEYKHKFFDRNTGTFALSEKSKTNLVLYYEQEQKMIRLFEKFPFPLEGCSIFSSEADRRIAMADLILAWEKLQNLGRFQECSCDCIGSIIKSIDVYLGKVKL
jgi:hypothetical protein